MNDKKLLELAYKAAKLELVWGDKFMVGGSEVDCTDLPYAKGADMDVAPYYWDPLLENSDAFELAIILKMDISQHKENQEKGYPAHVLVRHWYSSAQFMGVQAIEEHGQDAIAATRRAIVMVAAEIGKKMP